MFNIHKVVKHIKRLITYFIRLTENTEQLLEVVMWNRVGQKNKNTQQFGADQFIDPFLSFLYKHDGSSSHPRRIQHLQRQEETPSE